ncbi:MAG: FAD-dependent oxidoreductase, partial [Alphaproteobacteria bacterium]|nr:FAD-dependent oxidoreductase [Alphaproteobacteria bacterium]
GRAPDSLLDTYDVERVYGADENLLNSTRSTDFITPKSETSTCFRNAVLDLAERFEFARPLVNTGRLSVPCVYDGSSLNGPDCVDLPEGLRPGASAIDAPVGDGWLLDQLGDKFQLLALGVDVPDSLEVDGITIEALRIAPDASAQFGTRYLGGAKSAVYLMRPDQHVAARWIKYDEVAVKAALKTATGQGDAP